MSSLYAAPPTGIVPGVSESFSLSNYIRMVLARYNRYLKLMFINVFPFWLIDKNVEVIVIY